MAAPYYQMTHNFNTDALSLPADQLQKGLQSSPSSNASFVPSSAYNGQSTPQSSLQTQQPQPTSQSAQQSQTIPAARPAGGSGGGNRKGTSAERRATHNAIERARRESLNGRFLQLAASLPAISDVRRPSKSLVVNKSLDFVHTSLSREALYRHRLDSLRSENDTLRDQLNEFRRQAGLDPLPSPAVEELPRPLADMGGDKKRSASLSGGLFGAADLGDYDEEDGLHAASSEGEISRTSPASAAAAQPMPAVHVLPSEMAAYNSLPATQLPQHAHAAGLSQQTRASSTASNHSDDFGAQGSWSYASSSNGLGVAPPGSHFGGNFAFTAASNLLNGGGSATGVAASGTGASNAGQQVISPGFPSFAGLTQQQEPLTQPQTAQLDAFTAMRSQPQTYSQLLAGLGAAPTGSQAMATLPQQQFQQQAQHLPNQQLQLQPQHQQHQQHQHQHQHQYSQQHFFDPSPRQPPATFMTVA